MRFDLYLSNNGIETLFYSTSAADVRNAITDHTLKLELSKAGLLEFTIYPTHPCYDDFHQLLTYVRVEIDGEEEFRGRVLSVETSIYLERRVQVEGDLSYLVDSFQEPDKTDGSTSGSSISISNANAKSAIGSKASQSGWHNISWTVPRPGELDYDVTTAALGNQFATYINRHNQMMPTEKRFTPGYVTVASYDGEVREFNATNFRDTKSAIDGDLTNVYGGYLQTRRENGVVYIDWLKEPLDTGIQPIKMGVNMLEFDQNDDGSGVYSVLVPIGDKQLTIAGASIDSTATSDYEIVSVAGKMIGIAYTPAVTKYGYIYKTESFTGVTSASELVKEAVDFMRMDCKPDPKTFSIKAIDMHILDGSIDRIKIGTYVDIISEPHGANLRLCCTSIEYNIANPEDNQYEFGDPKDSFSQASKRQKTASVKAASSSSYAASSAYGYGSSLQNVVDRHASTIKDVADELFSIATKIFRIEAYAVEVNASEQVSITCGNFRLTSGGDIVIDASGDYNIGPLYIDVDGTFDIYDDVNIYGSLYVNDGVTLEDGSTVVFNGTGQGKTIIGSSEIKTTSLYAGTSGNNRRNLADAVVAFGQASASSSGVITIPYTTANNVSGTITFNMADTAFHRNAVSAVVVQNVIFHANTKTGYWDSTNRKYVLTADISLSNGNAAETWPPSGQEVVLDVYQTYLDGAVAAIAEATLSNVVADSSSSTGYSATLTFARSGTTIASKNIDVDGAVGGSTSTHNDILVADVQASMSQPSGTHFGTLETIIRAHYSEGYNERYIMFSARLSHETGTNRKWYWIYLPDA